MVIFHLHKIKRKERKKEAANVAYITVGVDVIYVFKNPINNRNKKTQHRDLY